MNKPKKHIIAAVIFLLCFVSVNVYAEDDNAEQCKTLFFKAKPEAVGACFGLQESEKTPEIKKILADMYYWGWGDRLDKNYEKAIELYKRAAGDGQLEAAYNLGVIYEKGLGITAQYEAAVKWYRYAAKRGFRDAQYNLANMYAKGAGIKANQRIAVEWYKKAAEQGDIDAAYNLGNRYAKGEGVNVDYVLSYKWYSIAQKSGDNDASILLEALKVHMSNFEIKEAQDLVKKWKIKVE